MTTSTHSHKAWTDKGGHVTPFARAEEIACTLQELFLSLAHLDGMHTMVTAICWRVLRPLMASMATLALNSGL